MHGVLNEDINNINKYVESYIDLSVFSQENVNAFMNHEIREMSLEDGTSIITRPIREFMDKNNLGFCGKSETKETINKETIRSIAKNCRGLTYYAERVLEHVYADETKYFIIYLIRYESKKSNRCTPIGFRIGYYDDKDRSYSGSLICVNKEYEGRGYGKLLMGAFLYCVNKYNDEIFTFQPRSPLVEKKLKSIGQINLDLDALAHHKINKVKLELSGGYSNHLAGLSYIAMGFRVSEKSREAYDRYGYDDEGYDDEGYDKEGYDKDGYDRDGYDRGGYDRNGIDEDNYNKDGYYKGLDEDCVDEDGVDEDGFEKPYSQNERIGPNDDLPNLKMSLFINELGDNKYNDIVRMVVDSSQVWKLINPEWRPNPHSAQDSAIFSKKRGPLTTLMKNIRTRRMFILEERESKRYKRQRVEERPKHIFMIEDDNDFKDAIAILENSNGGFITSVQFHPSYEIDLERISVLAQVLKQNKNKNVTHLNMNRNILGDNEAIVLAEALLENTTLISIDVGENNIGKKGRAALEKVFSYVDKNFKRKKSDGRMSLYGLYNV
jgi:hypothetical protein